MVGFIPPNKARFTASTVQQLLPQCNERKKQGSVYEFSELPGNLKTQQ